MAPLVTPAAATISCTEVRSKPRSANSRVASPIRRCRTGSSAPESRRETRVVPRAIDDLLIPAAKAYRLVG
jgi:hypothetical protein